MPLFRPIFRFPGWVRFTVPVLLLACCWLLVTRTRQVEARADSPLPLAPTLAYHPVLVRSSLDEIEGTSIATFPFEPGQTLSDVLDEIEVEVDETGNLIEELGRFADLRRIKPRDLYSVRSEEGRLVWFELVLSGKGAARAERLADGSGWTGSWREFERAVRSHVVAGSLEGSLEGSIARADGDPRLAISMSEVLQWDLDFTRDLRLGDRFRVIYETVYLDGSYESLGEIAALVYENGGRSMEAYRFGGEGRYYDAEGRPLRKMFLRSPMRYSRVTSRFSHRRFHPVLKRYRPHYGVDYGAPTGTPVRSTANGRVVFAGWDGGGGRVVKVRHPNGYLTAYLHLSRFASGVSSGRSVRQGDVIGYVGSTGLSTGPHLDYRVQRGGRWIDPLSLKSEPAEPLPEEQLDDFFSQRDALRRSLAEAPSVEDRLARESESRPAVAG